MHRTRIKYCGITSPQDGLAAARAGADAIGLVFYPRSKRHISVGRAAEIVKALPPMITAVALFVNVDPREIRSIAAELKIRTVQLHGDESPQVLGELDGLSVIKAVHCDVKNLAAILEQWQTAAKDAGDLTGLLLETSNPIEPGGTGVENDWAGIEAVLQSRHSSLPPLIAAGGLTAENVGQVVQRLRPWAVDVSSGIEDRPGTKSIEKMRRFTDAVHKADSLCPAPF